MPTKTWTKDEVTSWFAGQVPDDWFTGPVRVRIDREEILVIGSLVVPEQADSVAEASRIDAFREETRSARIRIAERAESTWGRKVSWGATCGDTETPFTTAAIPVMTRLRMDERAVLDTLIGAGVARSRSDSLGWCVRMVARHEEDWIGKLREAISGVEAIRNEGPAADQG
jgi:hypothetical protein